VTTTVILDTLTLEQIAGLTDQECNALYSELSAGVNPLRAYVCDPECPASVLEGLPGLVEKWTGHTPALMHIWRAPIDGWRANYESPNDAYDEPLRAAAAMIFAHPFHHLAHACLCAAFAACVVLGRAKE
jgi:hypothetical protein